ncbi:unnamed protein product [Amaranthus hypochondriacus]
MASSICFPANSAGTRNLRSVPLSNVMTLFPSAQGLEVTSSSVVKIGQSLYREGPGKDPFRPDQKTSTKFLPCWFTHKAGLRR